MLGIQSSSPINIQYTFKYIPHPPISTARKMTSTLNKPTSCFLIKKFIEVVAQRCSVKKVFLEISQNSQGNTCARVSGTVVSL